MRSQEDGWQEPYELRGSRTDLWERGGEIPPRHPTLHSDDIESSGKISSIGGFDYQTYCEIDSD